MKWHQTNKQSKDLRQKTRGCLIRSLETTLKSQRVSFGIVFSFSAFQTHIKVLQLYFRLQDRFYTHHWLLSLLKKNFLKMFASMSVQNKAAILFFFLFLDVIYKKKSFRFWYFMVSTTVHFLYLQTLFKKKEIKKNKKNTFR